jgi:hypothetical protein
VGRPLEQRLTGEAPLDSRSREGLTVASPRRRILGPTILLSRLNPSILPPFQGTPRQIYDPEPQKKRDRKES